MKQYDLNHGWLFQEMDAALTFLQSPREEVLVTLPHDFIIRKPRSENALGGPSNGYYGQGEGLYTKELEVQPDWEGKNVLLDMDGAYMNAEVTLNNHHLSTHPYGYTPYLTDLTPALRFHGKKNNLSIITQSRQPSTRWYSGGGIYRSVRLWVGNPIHIRPWDVFVSTSEVNEAGTSVRMKVKVTNTSAVDTAVRVVGRILEKSDSEELRLVVAAASEVTVSKGSSVETEMILCVKEPHLWNLDDPYLYHWQTEVEANGEIQDTAEDLFGIRTISISAERGFELNGNPLKLKGGCIHHDNGLLGACAYPKAEERKVRILKSVGYNAIRISHNPPSLEMLQACDRLGMLLLDEAFDVWRMRKVSMDYHLYFEDWWERDIEAMVCRDRNHPCVITYSIGNEIGERDGSSDGAVWAARLAAKVRSLDNTRFVLSALNAVFPDPEKIGNNLEANVLADVQQDFWAIVTEGYCKALDIVGYNYLYDRYERDHERYPDRVMLGTESNPIVAWENWQEVMAHPYVIGDFVWTAMDHLGEAGLGKVYWENENEEFGFLAAYPWRSSWSADIDLSGDQRPQSIYREILWGRKEKSAVFTTHPKHYGESWKGVPWYWEDVNDSWTFEDKYIGSKVQTVVYGAGDEAELILNNVSLGRVPFEKMKATMDIVYEPGVLEAVVYENGCEISRCALTTVGSASQAELWAEEMSVRANDRDLCYIHVDIVDEEGRRIPDDERMVTCRIECEGEAKAELLAIGSSNPCTEDPCGADWCHAFRGRALIQLKASHAGNIRVTVEAEGLPTATIPITIINE